ncbi:MAG: hypothetical protein DMG76_23840 [Acidobacteria bacterium]|nr:MAG: hypothetical protein DMG76_23840 [Acidobacteriota bacterium]
MALKKEYRCELCALEFDSYIELCPKCARPAKRAYRTAPGYITRGLVRRIDHILGAELRDRGLADLPKPRDFSDREPSKPYLAGEWDKCSGSGQIPISPQWGRGAVKNVNETFGTHFDAPASPGNSYSVPEASGPGRDYIRAHTQIVARIDKDGNRIG